MLLNFKRPSVSVVVIHFLLLLGFNLCWHGPYQSIPWFFSQTLAQLWCICRAVWRSDCEVNINFTSQLKVVHLSPSWTHSFYLQNSACPLMIRTGWKGGILMHRILLLQWVQTIHGLSMAPLSVSTMWGWPWQSWCDMWQMKTYLSKSGYTCMSDVLWEWYIIRLEWRWNVHGLPCQCLMLVYNHYQQPALLCALM